MLLQYKISDLFQQGQDIFSLSWVLDLHNSRVCTLSCQFNIVKELHSCFFLLSLHRQRRQLHFLSPCGQRKQAVRFVCTLHAQQRYKHSHALINKTRSILTFSTPISLYTCIIGSHKFTMYVV